MNKFFLYNINKINFNKKETILTNLKPCPVDIYQFHSDAALYDASSVCNSVVWALNEPTLCESTEGPGNVPTGAI